MKNKTLILASLLLVTMKSQAVIDKGLAQFKNSVAAALHIKASSSKMDSEPSESLKPIRYAKAKVHISKITAIKKGTHFEYEVKTVCDLTDNLLVFDFRKTTLPIDSNTIKIINCTSELKKNPITINIVGLVALGSMSSFYGEPGFDTKSFSGSIFLSGNDNPDGQFKFNFSQTRDLSAWSSILNLAGDFGYKCTTTDDENCEMTNPEIFSALVDFQDIN